MTVARTVAVDDSGGRVHTWRRNTACRRGGQLLPYWPEIEGQ